MTRRFESIADLPGQRPVTWRRSPAAIPLAALAGAAWPPLLLTLPFWPPRNWMPGIDMDWRLAALVVGLIFVPAGIWALRRERERTGRPATRLGVVWRFIFFGGLLSGALMTLVAVGLAVNGAVRSDNVGQAAGFIETAILINGLGGVPLFIMMGISWACWAGLCVAFIAFMHRPQVKDRLGLLGGDADA